MVEFSDDRRTVALPIRAALPVLTKAHSRADLHPSVGLLSGAALLGLRLVAAGQIEPARSDELHDGELHDPDHTEQNISQTKLKRTVSRLLQRAVGPTFRRGKLDQVGTFVAGTFIASVCRSRVRHA